MEAREASGEPSVQAGGYPWEITNTLEIPSVLNPVDSQVERGLQAVKNMKKVVVELPLGLIGDPQALPRCPQRRIQESGFEFNPNACPAGSRVGTLALAAGHFPTGDYETTNNSPNDVYGEYNIESEPGYPAVFGFTYVSQTAYIYATVVHSATGERVRPATVSAPPALETGDVMLTLWGEPGAFNGSESDGAFITNPSNCSAAPDKARVEVETWGHQGESVSAEGGRRQDAG